MFSGFLSKQRQEERAVQLSAEFNLPSRSAFQGITGFLPCGDSPCQRPGIGVAELCISLCLTGSAMFGRSGAVKDNLLVFLKRVKLQPESWQGD
jgi:hypothetical protein